MVPLDLLVLHAEEGGREGRARGARSHSDQRRVRKDYNAARRGRGAARRVTRRTLPPLKPRWTADGTAPTPAMQTVIITNGGNASSHVMVAPVKGKGLEDRGGAARAQRALSLVRQGAPGGFVESADATISASERRHVHVTSTSADDIAVTNVKKLSVKLAHGSSIVLMRRPLDQLRLQHLVQRSTKRVVAATRPTPRMPAPLHMRGPAFASPAALRPFSASTAAHCTSRARYVSAPTSPARRRVIEMRAPPPAPAVGDLGTLAADAVLRAAEASLAARGAFTLAVSGGSLPTQLAAGLAAAGDAYAAAEPARWTVVLGDERLVAHGHADSNLRLALETLPALSVLPVAEEGMEEDVQEVADKYAQIVRKGLSVSGGVFDMVLLGLGPDGHTASLFPGGGLLDGGEGTRLVVGVDDSPKPPPRRVSLSLSVLNSARAVAFVVGGAGKAGVVRDIFEDESCGLPGARVRPDLAGGELMWFFDSAAAAQLSATATAGEAKL